MNKELLETGLAALTEAAGMSQSTLELMKEVITRVATEMEAKPVGRYKPKRGDVYWFIGSAGDIAHIKWTDADWDKARYALGNVYRTKEEVHAALDKQLATVRVLDRIAELNAEQGWIADWGDEDQSKYYPLFDHGINKVVFCCNTFQKFLPDAYYGSEKTIETVINEMANDCKLMLGVGQ